MAEAQRRLTRADWVAAARDVFVDLGVGEVKVDRLARRLKISRGSFYWHFKSYNELLEALLNDWEERNREEMRGLRRRWTDIGADLSDVMTTWLAEDPQFPRFDMAVRLWARKLDVVDRAVRTVDAEWIDLLAEVFAKAGFAPDDAAARARVTYMHQVGFHALAFDEPFETRIAWARRYHVILTGRPLSPRAEAALERLFADRKQG